MHLLRLEGGGAVDMGRVLFREILACWSSTSPEVQGRGGEGGEGPGGGGGGGGVPERRKGKMGGKEDRV